MLDDEVQLLASRGGLAERRNDVESWLAGKREAFKTGVLPLAELVLFEEKLPGWRYLDVDDLDEGWHLRNKSRWAGWAADWFTLGREGRLADGGIEAADEWLQSHRDRRQVRIWQKALQSVNQEFPGRRFLTAAQMDWLAQPEHADVLEAFPGLEDFHWYSLREFIDAVDEYPNLSERTLKSMRHALDSDTRWARRKDHKPHPTLDLWDKYTPGWRKKAGSLSSQSAYSSESDSESTFDFHRRVGQHYREGSFAEYCTAALHGQLMFNDRYNTNRWLKRVRAEGETGLLTDQELAMLDRAMPQWQTKPATTLDRLWRESTLEHVRADPRPITNQDECFLYVIENSGVRIDDPVVGPWMDELLKEMAVGAEPAGVKERLSAVDDWDEWPGMMRSREKEPATLRQAHPGIR